MSTSNFVTPDEARPDAQGHPEHQISSLTLKTRAFFAAHGAENLKRVRDHLFELVDARPHVEKAQNLRSAFGHLNKQAEVFNRVFQAALNSAIDEEVRLMLAKAVGGEARSSAPIDLSDDLSLVDFGQVERILLVDRVAQRFTSRYEASLGPLTLRLAVLLGQDASLLPCNPFRAEVFVRAFLTAWEKCDLDPRATEDLMLSLEPQHCIDLAPWYEDLNATLAQTGIHAQVVHRIRRTPGPVSSFSTLGPASLPAALEEVKATQPGAVSGMGSVAPVTSSSNWGGLASAGRSIAAHARQFLRKLGIAKLPDHDAGPAAQAPHAAADPEFMGYLGDLQAGASSSENVQGGQEPADHNVLRRLRDSDQVRRAPDLDRGTVDALAEVFDYVFADQAIPLQMKYVIGRLQIPVLKAAMIDRDFFLSNDHPARRLVDTLAQASVTWAPEKGEDDPLYVRIEGTVQRVLNEFEDDLNLFAELLRDFTAFLFESEQQAQAHIEPTADIERVDESFEQALAHADEVVHDRLKALPPETPLAPFLAPFLTNQWREVMAHAWTTVQDDPAPWEGANKTMDQLIWSTQPKTKSDERRELVAILPELVRSLNAGLDAIEWSGDPRATFTRRLISTHMMAIRMTQPAARDSDTAALEERASKDAMQELDQRVASQLTGSEDEFDELAHSFTRGLWFDFKVDDTLQRSRLSWVSPMRTRMLFTNRDGFDAFVRSEREVAALMRLGRLKVVDQVPIVSRALDRIMAA
ncbi:MAG: DUF1631 domain-containing protein [Rhodoferax sp.]|nr:DUF1631 domain-containing protein [Rhodoferax sp.]